MRRDPGTVASPALEPQQLPLIGCRERVALPEWGIENLHAKIDTGARTSAIDVAVIEHLSDGRVRFEVVRRHRPTRETKWVEADPVRTTVVKPSSGERQERVVCRTMLRIGPFEQEVELSLVCRAGMLCRMLIGRAALAEVFWVDPSRRYLLSGPRKRRGGSRS